MDERYALRLDTEGWTVFDKTSGRAVLVGSRKQQGLEFDEAEKLARKLNRESGIGIRRPRNPVQVRG